MATREFKIRHGLIVQGDFTLGGNTVSKVLDSDEVINIINDNVTGLADSDLAVVATLRQDVDSDSTAIQTIKTDLDALDTSLTARLDSDSTAISARLPLSGGTMSGDIDGAGNKVLFANVYSNFVDLPDASTYHGMFAHVHATGAGYFAHAGNWVRLSNYTDAALKSDLDSETARIQLLLASTDSDALSLAELRQSADSDANTILILRQNAESDSIAIQALQSSLSPRLDSDESKLQTHSGRLDVLETRADSDSIAIQATKTDMDVNFNIVNNGASAYTYSGDGFPSNVDNPTIYLNRGHTYNFRVNASGHPFQIRTASGGSAYSSGVTNNGAQVGLIKFVVPMDAPESLVYQCTLHSGMVGNIKIDNADASIADSDLKAIADLRNDVDSDTAAIQTIRTDLDNLDTTLTARLDSDTAAIQTLRTDFDALDTSLTARLDSDELALQTLDTKVTTLQARADSDNLAIQDLGTRIDNLGGSQSINVTTFTFTASNNDSDFSGTDDNGSTLSYVANKIHVYLNGILLTNTTDYIATDGSTVSLVSAPDSDDVLSIVKFLGTVQAGFDSDEIVSIINENVVSGSVDSDVAAVAQLRRDADSDSIRIQEIATSLEQINELVDSDLKAIADLRNDVDSDSLAIGNINRNIGSSNLDGVGQTQQVFDSFATSYYRSVKYFVSASSNDSSWFATEIIVIHDGTNAYLTEYGTISTHDSEFITFDADVNGGNVRLLGTPSNSLTNVKTVRQHISQT